MTLPPKKIREIVFLILYSQDIQPHDEESKDEFEEMVRRELKIARKFYLEALERVNTIHEYLPTIDLNIARISTAYDFKRIQSVERNLLRLGSFEILFDANIPPKVAIAEAVRLAKKFSTPASCQFVNAILDNLYKESIGQSIDEKAIVQSSLLLEDEEMEHAD